MCGICGVVARGDDEGNDAMGPLREMLGAMSHRGPDSAGATWGAGTRTADSLEELLAKIEDVRAPRAVGHIRLSITGQTGTQPFENGPNFPKLVFNGEIYNFRSLIDEHFGDGGLVTDNDGELLFELINSRFRGHAGHALNDTVDALDGVYALAVMDESGISLYRDTVGVKQVYWGINGDYVAFASERKALWKIGLKSRRLNPGELLRIENEGSAQVVGRDKLSLSKVRHRNRKAALDVYRTSLLAAVEKRVVGHDHVGVLFSGGVDSCMVAAVAREMCPHVTAYAGGVAGSPDLEAARAAADKMGLELRVHPLTSENLDELIPDTVKAIEDNGLMQVEVALPMFAALKLAAEDGVRVMLTGQGADELFGGYEWYPPILARDGDSAVIRAMWTDINNLYRDTLEREDKMSMWHSIELRVPFLDPHLIDRAMSIAPEHKIRNNGSLDRMGKRIHRKLAAELGVPHEIAYRLKDGAQHGSGIHRALERYAARLDTPVVEAPDLDEPEVRGSAYRHEGIDVENGSYGSAEARALIDSIAREAFAV
jgi:asparagine synthase (glutamine-hydrolysing)